MIGTVITRHQENCSLQQMKTTTENLTQPKCRVVDSSPSGYIYKHSHTHGPGNILKSEGRMILRAKR